MIEYLILYVISILVCLFAFVYEHAWVKGYDIRFPIFLCMIMIAFIPLLNLVVLVSIVDLSWLNKKFDFVVIKGRRE
jgi:hypothetical protein